jgi:hypothetical protein
MSTDDDETIRDLHHRLVAANSVANSKHTSSASTAARHIEVSND